MYQSTPTGASEQAPQADAASAEAGASAEQSTAKDAEFTEEKPGEEPKV
jgi:hypothetical protein